MDITIKINNCKSATDSKARSPHIALIAAAGKGTRMRTEVPKQLLCYKGKAVVERTASVFAAHEEIDAVFLLIPQDKEYDETFFQIADRLECLYGKPIRCSYGGNSRGESVYNGLQAISSYLDENGEAHNDCASGAGEVVILIHDAARAEITSEVIDRNIAAMSDNEAVCTVVPMIDSLRMTEKSASEFFDDLSSHNDYLIINSKSIDRDRVVAVQTPQCFKLSSLMAAYDKARRDGYVGTDDASIAEHFGIDIALVEGDYANTKITTGKDIPMGIRVGTGYDVHRLAEGHRLILCGVPLPSDRGLVGHSDADVATHALMDALLGAACLGDIGKHFPDTDERYKGADSIALLREVKEKIGDVSIGNVDITIIAEKPKLAPYIDKMRENIAVALEMPIGAVNVKATTTEKLGFTGREEGIAAQAVCTIEGRF
nr:2-C-methyl-D-erythritol 2,4-cyclodiphosphate synthase [Mogibacterium diversum]